MAKISGKIAFFCKKILKRNFVLLFLRLLCKPYILWHREEPFICALTWLETPESLTQLSTFHSDLLPSLSKMSNCHFHRKTTYDISIGGYRGNLLSVSVQMRICHLQRKTTYNFALSILIMGSNEGSLKVLGDCETGFKWTVIQTYFFDRKASKASKRGWFSPNVKKKKNMDDANIKSNFFVRKIFLKNSRLCSALFGIYNIHLYHLSLNFLYKHFPYCLTHIA